MNAKYVKRKCSVRGCKNTSSYMISLTREMGNSVIICRECAKAASAAIGKAEKERPKEKKKTGIPPLFFNSSVKAGEQLQNKSVSVNEDGDGVNTGTTE
ncbi:MAG: hypothetical protein IJA60_02625 [Clostridia bacterium]|nr:hypothetical protein [Clostridia bacterium]